MTAPCVPVVQSPSRSCTGARAAAVGIKASRRNAIRRIRMVLDPRGPANRIWICYARFPKRRSGLAVDPDPSAGDVHVRPRQARAVRDEDRRAAVVVGAAEGGAVKGARQGAVSDLLRRNGRRGGGGNQGKQQERDQDGSHGPRPGKRRRKD